jgi:hypothetical protein
MKARIIVAVFAGCLLMACGDLETSDRDRVDVFVHGAGQVRMDSLGIGSSGFREVALVPLPEMGHVFDRWEGEASGHDSPLIVPVIGRVEIHAHFKPVPEPQVFDGIAFSFVPAGTYLRGSEYPFEDSRELPVREVSVSRPFHMSTFEITQAIWYQVMGIDLPVGFAPDLPITGVSWFDVRDFLTRLNQRAVEGQYRLPTEAEWEYACRAGTTTDYFHGSDIDRLGSYVWSAENWEAGPGFHRVGQRRPNRWGLYDMLGNAWEWVQDGFDPAYYGIGPTIDPTGPASASLGRVIRGGGPSSIGWTRCSARFAVFPEVPAEDVGFRIVRIMQ